MIVFSIEEFAARRRKAQTNLEASLLLFVEQALADLADGLEGWDDVLLGHLEAEFDDIYRDEGGVGTPSPAKFINSLRPALAKTTPDSDAKVIATWLSTALLNAATIAAVESDEEFLVLEWVTMNDDDVRETHQDVEGQQRPPGEPFDVGGTEMLYPGQPVEDVALWINCRCSLAPALPDASFHVETMAISEKPWSGSASRFTDEEWKRSCVVHLADTLVKSDHKLPIREPNGDLSRAGVHAAAGRINQTDAPPEKIASAKRALRGAYKTLGEDPPDSITAAAEGEVMDPEVEIEETDDSVDPTPHPLAWHGVLAPENVWSGDGRMFATDSLTHRDLPLPLTWQKASSDGHSGSITVARIDAIARVDGEMRGAGVFLMNAEADEVVGMIAEFGKFGVSVDADDAEMEFDEESGKVSFSKARIASASIVAIPAFAEAYVALGDHPEGFMGEMPEVATEEDLAAATEREEFKRGAGWITHPEETRRIHKYWTQPGQPGFIKIGWGKGGDFNRCRVLVGEKIATNSPEDMRYINQICAQWHHDALGIWPGEHKAAGETLEATDASPAISLVASGQGGNVAPAAWFKDPEFTEITPFTITEEGEVFGHIAHWTQCHLDSSSYGNICVAPPRSSTGYAHYLTGAALLDDGSQVPAAVISVGGGHAPKGLHARAALAHYDDASTAGAIVTCGEDEHGIWVHGWCPPGTSPEMVTAMRACPPSGDWRKIGGSMEMIAALSVNVQGFPVPRVQIAASNGSQISLVAAGKVESKPETAEFDIDTFAMAVALHIEKAQKRRERVAALAARAKGTD